MQQFGGLYPAPVCVVPPNNNTQIGTGGTSVIFAHQFLVKRFFPPSSGTKSRNKKQK